MLEVKVEAVVIDNTTDSPVMLLRERDGDRVLPVFIGPFEASAIAYALQGTQFTRPLTLDLFKLVIQGLGGRVARVIVTRLEQETFYAEVVLEKNGQVVAIDARPSDSVGLALVTGAPIYVAEAVMDEAGRWLSPEDEERLKELRAKLRNIDPEEFGNYQIEP